MSEKVELDNKYWAAYSPEGHLISCVTKDKDELKQYIQANWLAKGESGFFSTDREWRYYERDGFRIICVEIREIKKPHEPLSEKVELKACAHCGREAKLEIDHMVQDQAGVFCECGVNIFWAPREQVIAAWNSRQPEGSGE